MGQKADFVLHNSYINYLLLIAVLTVTACGPMPQQGRTPSRSTESISQDPVVHVGLLEKQLAARGLDFEVRMKASFGEPAWNATWTDGSYANFDKSKTNLEPIRGLLLAFTREAETALKVMPADAKTADKSASIPETDDFVMEADGSPAKTETAVAPSSPRARLQAQLELVQSTLRNLNQFTKPQGAALETEAVALDRGQGQD